MRSPFIVVLSCIAVWFGFLTILPYVLQVLHPSSAGLTVLRDKDWGNYDSRLQRALEGYPAEAANAITPIGSGITGLQTAGIEQVAGVLLGWTGIPAPPLAVVLTALLTPFLFLLFVFLFREAGFPRSWSTGMTLVLFAVMFHVLSRMPHPGWSFLPTILAFLCFLHFWRQPSGILLVITGLLLGILPYLYFWHWTYAWSVVLLIALLSIGALPQDQFLRRHPLWSLLLGLLILLVSFPFVVHTWHLMADPLYPEVAVRASFLYQRTPESWPRTILLLLQCGLFLSLWPTHRRDRSYIIALGFLLGILVAMHQNVLHAKVLMFASHFYPHLLLSTTIAGAWVWSRPIDPLRRIAIAAIAVLFLSAGAWDYAFMHRFFVPSARDFADQHLLTPVALLQGRPPATVLTDATTGRVLTAWTPSGIVYTTHARFLFISDREMAERYCVTEMFVPTPDSYRSLYIEYNRVLDSPAMRAREQSLVKEACARVQADPRAFLTRYDVRYVLWNSRLRPDWVVPAFLRPWASGSGWTLWEVPR